MVTLFFGGWGGGGGFFVWNESLFLVKELIGVSYPTRNWICQHNKGFNGHGPMVFVYGKKRKLLRGGLLGKEKTLTRGVSLDKEKILEEE